MEKKSVCKNGADDMVLFQLMISKVLRQVKETKGVMSYAVKADFSKKALLDARFKKQNYS
jgi:hypothetical protein